MKTYCVDCGIKLKRYNANRCWQCYVLWAKIPENNPMFGVQLFGKENGMFGKNHSIETKRKIAKTRDKYVGKNHPNYKGYRVSHGYIYIHMPTHPFNKRGYVKRANLVMEKKLGRYLQSPELIHHKDENRLNDDISNLILCQNNAKHRNLHKKG
jgi:hypothetical protein